MTSVWILIAALAFATAAMKVAGPLALGGRALPTSALDIVECWPPRCSRRWSWWRRSARAAG